ncbi:hypothetical protein B0A50_06562 [Salinomyces thailandicus]|uniref:Uncharacterized protein n=1 Tax=Salinomyces thailandicus TaxID=706561 RepID=A0A4U0TRN5_9PEZI|nr:hypothetical protein B0A50_06562 [Salinomyces thailandica]
MSSRYHPPSLPAPRPSLSRTQSISSLPLTHSPLDTRARALTGYNNNNHPFFQHYLPGLAGRNLDTNSEIWHFIRQNEDIMENGGSDILCASDLFPVFTYLLQTLQSYGQRGYEDYISDQMIRLLERRFAEDDAEFVRLRSRDHPYTLRLFLALSAISQQTQSLQLGMALCSFFGRAVEYIAEQDSAEALAHWAWAVYRAYMPDNEQIACLAELLHRRPRLVEDMLGLRQRNAAEIVGVLRNLQREFNPLDDRRRRFGGRDYNDDSYLSDIGRRCGLRSRSPLRIGSGNTVGFPRSRSAPGDRRAIERQADRVIDMADDMRTEAERLKRLAG